MNKPAERICLWLASSELRASEIRDFARWLDMRGADHLVETIEKIRTSVSQAVSETGSVGIAEEPRSSLAWHSIEKNVATLLLSEAKFTRTEAARLLRQELLRFPETPRTLYPLNKQPFTAWVRRIAQDVSPSLLLHVATRLRNERVNPGNTDWPLKK
jgi:hypothetical protein